MLKSHTLFISDLHLSEACPQTTEILLHFLENTAKHADALYILGDFFELWLGNDDRTPLNEQIKAALRQYTHQGIPTYFMHGNRDFLVRQDFSQETGVTLLKEPTRLHLYGQDVLLLHGDSLCTLDKRHQKFRKIIHNRFCQTLALSLPLSIRKYYGQRIRSTSSERKSHLPDNIMDVSPEEVTRVMTEAQVNTLIHGHTHRPAIHSIDGGKKKRIVLGAWHTKGSYLRIDEDNQATLEEISTHTDTT
jgi:UDP-2,3-diacylglucosamine hydrolase